MWNFSLKILSYTKDRNEVVSRAIEMWDNVKREIEEFVSLAWSKRPKNQDPSVVIKFQFFQDLPNMLEIFLKDFQTDKPMIPFLSDVLKNHVCRLLQMFITVNVY